MKLDNIAYMCLEILRGGHLVDDERLDIRLIKDWIDLKRAQYIRNSRNNNPNSRIDSNIYQPLEVTLQVTNVTDVGDYPYSNDTTQLYKIVESTTNIPSILDDKTNLVVYSIETKDLMKLPFSFVHYDHLRFAGNGKFNTNLIYAALRDNTLYFKYNSFFDTYTTVVLRAAFQNPRDVSGFDEDTDDYPASLELIESIKNGVLDIDIRNFLAARTDEVSDNSGFINK